MEPGSDAGFARRSILGGGMLKDGVYELFYRAEADPEGGYESLLLSLRNGNVLGSDRWGGVFTGRCDFDIGANQHRVNVRLLVPPGGMLVTDDAPRMLGDQIDVAVTLGRSREISSGFGLVDVGGQRVRVELQFKGPVPG